MRKERRSVFGLQNALLRSVGELPLDIAVITTGGPGFGRRGIRQRRPQAGIVRRVGGVGPIRLDRVGGLHRVPGGAGDHREAAAYVGVDGHHLDDARHPRRFGRLHRAHGSAQPGVHPHRGENHVGQRDVDAEDRRASHLGAHVCARLRLAQQAPLRARPQRHIRCRSPLGRRHGNLAVGKAPAARRMRDYTAGGRQRGGGHAQPFGRFGLQRLARHGARVAHLFISVGGRGGAARYLQREELADDSHAPAREFGHGRFVELRKQQVVLEHPRIGVGGRGRAVLHLDLVELDVEFLGDQRSERRFDALPHLGARRDDGDLVVAGDLEVGVEGGFALAQRVLQRIGEGLAV